MTYKVVIDPGHGGQDSGAVGNGLLEKNLTLNIAKKVADILEQSYPGIKPILTRTKDEYIKLSKRTTFANGINSDALVSIHINSASDKLANGFESFVYTTDDGTTKSHKLQKHLHKELSELWKKSGRADRGTKKANFHMVREYKGASVLLELGFIVNDNDAKLLKSESFLTQNAEKIAKGIADYFGVKSNKNKSAIYRVIVDGTQTGAYAERHNIVDQVERALKQGKQDIKLTKI